VRRERALDAREASRVPEARLRALAAELGVSVRRINQLLVLCRE